MISFSSYSCTQAHIVFAVILTISGTSSSSSVHHDCVNPIGKYGTCIEITKCPALFKILQQTDVNREAVKFLQKSTCGFSSGNPKVCCLIPTTVSVSKIPSPSGNSDSHKEKPTPSSVVPVPSIEQHSEPSLVTLSLVPNNRSLASVSQQIEHHPNLRLLPTDRVCGLSNSLDRIVGGEKTGLGTYPWMVLLGVLDPDNQIQFACGGTLISKKYVLTASHCVTKLPTGFKLQVARVGEYDQTQEIDCSDEGICAPIYEDVEIEEIIPHEEYDKAHRKENDIALLRLKREVSYGTFVGPVCLPLREQQLGNSQVNDLDRLLVAGWGRTLTSREDGSPVLQHVSLPLVGDRKCNEFYRKRLSGSDIGTGRFCAGGEKDLDSCKGDSGGPLMGSLTLRRHQHRTFQFGVVSLGPPRCGGESEPGLYTKVSTYIPWILDKLKP